MGGACGSDCRLFCPGCTFPAEYCEFNADFDKCKPWIKEKFPDLYEDIDNVPSALLSKKGPRSAQRMVTVALSVSCLCTDLGKKMGDLSIDAPEKAKKKKSGTRRERKSAGRAAV